MPFGSGYVNSDDATQPLALLPPGWLNMKDEFEPDELLDPLDLLPLLELLDDDPVDAIVRPESPLLPAEFEIPGPWLLSRGPWSHTER